MRDKTKTIAGIAFLFGAAYCALNIVTKEMESFYISGLVIFTIVGLAFIRNAKY